MATNYPSMLLLALLVAVSAPLAHSIVIINGITIAQLNVAGRLVCSISGNPVAGTDSPGLAGAGVSLVCNNGHTKLSQALTNTTGFFQVVLNTVDSISFDASSCAIIVGLPIGTCTLLPPTGNLQGTITLVGIVQSTLGAVAEFVTAPFRTVG